MPEVRATLRYLRTSPPKVRQVVGLIRGLDVDDARETLRFCERSAAGEVRKLLDSAVANAEHNENVPSDELFVHRAYVDEGPTLKRWRPRARGRGTRIRKRTSHLTIIVSRFADEELERRREREAAAAPTTRRRPTRRRARPAAEEPEHDHEHDEDAATGVDVTEVETEPGESVKKAPAKKKALAKKTTAKKTTAKKVTRKTTGKSTRKRDT
jgi:large subunit ribosomal protein L22